MYNNIKNKIYRNKLRRLEPHIKMMLKEIKDINLQKDILCS